MDRRHTPRVALEFGKDSRLSRATVNAIIEAARKPAMAARAPATRQRRHAEAF
jgi:hypothetical protein